MSDKQSNDSKLYVFYICMRGRSMTYDFDWAGAEMRREESVFWEISVTEYIGRLWCGFIKNYYDVRNTGPKFRKLFVYI